VNALGHPISRRTTALPRGPEVKGDITADPEHLSLVIEDVGNLGIPQQRLRRNAADVVADTAPVLQLDNGGFQAKLPGADRGDISAGSRT
jgi:hypothetical protein